MTSAAAGSAEGGVGTVSGAGTSALAAFGSTGAAAGPPRGEPLRGEPLAAGGGGKL